MLFIAYRVGFSQHRIPPCLNMKQHNMSDSGLRNSKLIFALFYNFVETFLKIFSTLFKIFLKFKNF